MKQLALAVIAGRLCVILSDENRGQWSSSGGTKYAATPYFFDEHTIVRDPEFIIAYRDMDLDGKRYCIDQFMVNSAKPISTEKIATIGTWKKSQPAH
jgi:hypothetical protein